MLRGRRIMETLAEMRERKKNKRHAAIAQEVKNTNERKILTTYHHDRRVTKENKIRNQVTKSQST